MLCKAKEQFLGTGPRSRLNGDLHNAHHLSSQASPTYLESHQRHGRDLRRPCDRYDGRAITSGETESSTAMIWFEVLGTFTVTGLLLAAFSYATDNSLCMFGSLDLAAVLFSRFWRQIS